MTASLCLLDKVRFDAKENNVPVKIEEIQDNLIVVLGDTNDIYLLQNSKIAFQSKCTTWKNWFWNVLWTKTTPLWLHKIIWYYWDCLPKEAILKWRVDTGRRLEYYPSYPNVYPVIISRILQLQWIEERNSNTEKRYIYIHWTPNTWYWDKDTFKQSYWCIGLKPDDIINLFEKVNKKETFLYIMN